MICLEDYRDIVGDEILTALYRKTRRLYGQRVVHINSTFQGGGVAEMLNSLLPLMNDVGIEAGWRILHGNQDFFTITKSLHNRLQGEHINFTEEDKALYLRGNEAFSVFTHLNHNCVICHDPQTLPLIMSYKKRQPWIWRCHVDLSSPDKELWDYLKGFALHYDMVIVSNEKYTKQDLAVEQRIVCPAIDPLSHKNKEPTQDMIDDRLKKFEVPLDKPLVTQISRFDKWKDPLGVVEAFQLARQEVDCRLVLCGDMASDDPEGIVIYDQVREKAADLVERGEVILLSAADSMLVNVLQRVSAVIVQASIREGFGLTVTEALWKGTPVIASNVGGIPLQITDGVNGFLVEPRDVQGLARNIVRIVKDPEMARGLGRNGREAVRERFLITRLLSDYLDIFNELLT